MRRLRRKRRPTAAPSSQLTAVPQKEGFLVEKCKNPDCKKSGYRMRENAEYCTNKCKRKHEKALAKEKIEEQELVLEIVEKPKFRQLNMFGNDD